MFGLMEGKNRIDGRMQKGAFWGAKAHKGIASR